MATLITKVNIQSVENSIGGIKDPTQPADSYVILDLMKEVPKMWGSSIVGFGLNRYVYGSGHEGDRFVMGFSPRKQNMTLYLMDCFVATRPLLKNLGNIKPSCPDCISKR